MVESFEGRVAFVTGAASGIGEGIANALARRGAAVALSDRDQDQLGVAVERIEKAGGRALGVPLDVTDRDGWAGARTQVHDTLGQVSILVNNAGISTLGVPFADVTPDLWDLTIGINLTGVFNGVQTFLGDVIAGHGHLVNTSSLGGLMGQAGNAPYSVSKCGVVALSEALFLELKEQGVGVTVLCPGPVRSRLWQTSRRARGLPEIEQPSDPLAGQSATAATTPDQIGELVIEAMRRNQLYAMTHGEFRMMSTARQQLVDSGWDFADEVGFQANLPDALLNLER